MKIIFRQTESDRTLESFGFRDCCLKKLKFGPDARVTTLKTHHHNEFEIHLITNGAQSYEVCGALRRLDAGMCIIIPPGIRHRMIEVEADTEKYAISFKYDFRTQMLSVARLDECTVLETPEAVLEAIGFVQKESAGQGELSRALCENRLLEGIVLLLRQLGLDEKSEAVAEQTLPPMLLMAKQYIADNIESAPTVADVAIYCHIGEKQLTRIFARYEEITVFEYIRCERIECAKRLLTDGEQSLRQISECMNFASEYYFNEFFRKNCGMPPGAYRRMR